MTVLNPGDSDLLSEEVRDLAKRKGLELIIRDYEILIYRKGDLFSIASFHTDSPIHSDPYFDMKAESFIEEYEPPYEKNNATNQTTNPPHNQHGNVE